MTVLDPDQGITLNVGTDPANLPSQQNSEFAGLLSRMNLRYATEAVRTANHPVSVEGEESYLLAENRAERYDGATWISRYTGDLYACIRKTIDQSVNNSIVLANDTQFLVPLPVAGIFQWRHLIFCDGDIGADIKFAYTIPAGATMRWGGNGPDSTVAAAGTGPGQWGSTSTPGGVINYGTAAVNTVTTVTLEGEISMGGIAGNLQFQFAQVAAIVANTTVRARSRLEVWRFS